MATFTYKGKNFLLNGEKFIIRSGAIHYFRVKNEDWYDRLLKLKECGFNTVETYVAWNLHEPREGEFYFDGDLDLAKFIDTANALGLYALVRPGPFICAEFDFGGLPSWLLSYPNIKLRCYDETYLSKVRAFFTRLFEIVTPRLITNGGNILMVQIENEYGSFGNDKHYLQALVDMNRALGVDCLLFTSDGVLPVMTECGSHSDCLATVNFGSQAETKMKTLEERRPNQPLMCMEFWCGWFDYLRDEHHTQRNVDEVCSEIEVFLKNGYSFNVYMFIGGTNFAFTNGATDIEDKYKPITTSYDYGALLTENGTRTPLYYAIRDLFLRYGVKDNGLTAKDVETIEYGKVTFTDVASLFDNLQIGNTTRSTTPLYMEELGQSSGYILYETQLFAGAIKGDFVLDDYADRALVFVNGERVGIFEQGVASEKITLDTAEIPNAKLQILVENTGRINYGPHIYGKKGIAGARIWNIQFFDWVTTGLPMCDLSALRYDKELSPRATPAFYKGNFAVETVGDTFLSVDGFSKGFVMINGFNLGRYFTQAGPQKALYVPSSVLKKGTNEIVVFDSDGANSLDAKFIKNV